MTVKQAAAVLESSEALVYALCQIGALRHSRVGLPGKRGSIRISEEAIAEYLKAREVGPERVAAPAPRPARKLKLSHLEIP
jgi:excisionase family DNA binding protein